MKNLYWFCLFAGLLMTSCVKPPDYPTEPTIGFVSVGRTTLKQDVDTTLVTISFTDGDGDLGVSDTDPTTNYIITDTRTGFQEFYKIPLISQQGVGNGISGEISVELRAQCCIPTTGVPCLPNPGQMPEDIIYTIQITDRAGNASNIVDLPPITLICD